MKQLYTIIMILVICACNKDFDNSDQASEVRLPNYSESGVMTFGFLLNDTPWTNFGSYYRSSDIIPGWRKNYVTSGYNNAGTQDKKALSVVGRLTIVQSNKEVRDISASFSFVLEPPFIRTYNLDGIYPRVFNVLDNLRHKSYQVSSSRPFTIKVTKFDNVNKICSGRFSGTLYDLQHVDDSITVKDGRFDVKYP